MFLDEKPFIYLWRPLYRRLLVPYVYPVLNRAGNPAVVDFRNEIDRLQEQNRTLQKQLTDLDNLIRQLIARSSQLEDDLRSQWLSTEQLILCILSQPIHND